MEKFYKNHPLSEGQNFVAWLQKVALGYQTTFFAHCIPMLKIMVVMVLFLWYNVGAFFKEQLWNTIRFLIALFLILSLIEAQLQMKSEYQAKRKTICKTFS